ncbi:MAG: saccharopine dehydrogenase C-terminal domain-containing protein [candidate division WOR-3 bacterium]|nr:hypothetical protein [candidate division WOR-3 bacterium]MDW8150088.1 saccharopine dehydrogenase C-terminal domain-containing protein [candidate division WOR-3 bacterium]
MKKAVILGLGKMGFSILEQIFEISKNLEIFAYDINKDREREVISKHGQVKLLRTLDENVVFALKRLKPDIIINATTFVNNLFYTQIAIEVNSNYVDLGQNAWTTIKQRSLDSIAREKRILIVPETGLAPGTINILGVEFIEKGYDRVYLYTGGLPLDSSVGGILRYGSTWSIEGLIQEYTDVVVSLEDGKVKFKNGLLSEIERDLKIKFRDKKTYEKIKDFQKVEFEKNYYYVSDLEAIPTSDGISLMPFDYKIKDLEYRTIRYGGHYETIKVLYNLGFLDESKYIQNRKLKEITIDILNNVVPNISQDIVFLKVVGISNNSVSEINGICLYDENYTAMQKMTGYSAVVCALSIIDELDLLRDKKHGVVMPYEIFDSKKYVSFLQSIVKHLEIGYYD